MESSQCCENARLTDQSHQQYGCGDKGDEKGRGECCPLIGARVRTVVTVTCCFFCSWTLGTIYAFGNINPYLTSYLRNCSSNHDIDFTDTFWVLQVSNIVCCALMAPLGILANCLHPRLFLTLGLACHSGSFLATYWTMQQSFPLVVLTYGALGGIAYAIVDPVTFRFGVGGVREWTGLVGAVVLMGYGVGAVLWNELATWFINPNNLRPDLAVGEDVYFTQPEVLERVPQCFLLLGAVCGGTQLLCLLLMCMPPPSSTSQQTVYTGGKEEEEEEEREGLLAADHTLTQAPVAINSDSWDRRAGGVSGSDRGAREGGQAQHRADGSAAATGQQRGAVRAARAGERHYHPFQVLRSRAFWTLWFLIAFGSVGISFVLTFFKAYGQTFINDDHFLALVASLSSVCNAAGRPFWGHLADRIGHRMVMLLAQCMVAVLVGSLIICEVAGKVMFLVWVCGIFLAICGYFTMQYTLTLTLFGSRYYSINLGLVNTNSVISIIIAGVIAPVVKGALGWHGIFYVSFAGFLVGILLNMSLSIRCGNSIPAHLRPALSLPS